MNEITRDLTLAQAAARGITVSDVLQLANRHGLMMKEFATSPPTAVHTHGAGGLFRPAAEQQMFSALIGLQSGFESTLPLRPSRYVDPTVRVITGMEEVDETGINPGEECGNWPKAGKLKTCMIGNWPYGHYGMASDTLNIAAAGQLYDRADFNDYSILGSPFSGDPDERNIPAMFGLRDISDVANNDAVKILFELAQSMQLFYGREALYGNPADNDPSVNGVKHSRGLYLLINDEYSDLVSGEDCDRVDSIVLDFETLVGEGTPTIEASPEVAVRAIIETLAKLNRRSMLMFGVPWQGYLHMHYTLFRQLVFVWAATYYTYRQATGSDDTRRNLDAVRLVDMMTDMLNNAYLVGDSGRIPVVLDVAIQEDIDENTHSSTIAFVNTRIRSTITSYQEYFPFNLDQTAQGMINRLGNGSIFHRVVDNGRFLVHYLPPTGSCYGLEVEWKTRIRVNCPWLCARIDNIGYVPDPFAIDETPFPGDEGYLNGGTSGPLPGAPGTEAVITACADSDPPDGEITFTLASTLNCTLGTNVLVIVGNLQIPAVISAGNNTTSVTVDFTTAATPVPLQDVECADITFVGGVLRCNF